MTNINNLPTQEDLVCKVVLPPDLEPFVSLRPKPGVVSSVNLEQVVANLHSTDLYVETLSSGVKTLFYSEAGSCQSTYMLFEPTGSGYLMTSINQANHVDGGDSVYTHVIYTYDELGRLATVSNNFKFYGKVFIEDVKYVYDSIGGFRTSTSSDIVR